MTFMALEALDVFDLALLYQMKHKVTLIGTGIVPDKGERQLCSCLNKLLSP